MKKVLLGLLGVVIIIVLAIITTVWIVKANDAKNSDKPVVLGQGNSKNALIIYQNGRSSFSRKVAENIANGLVEDGYKVVTNQPGDFLEKDLSKYDVVLFGSPVYAGQTSLQIKKYADSIENYGNAKVICYCIGKDKDKDESVEFKDCFNGKAIDSFKIVKEQFDKNKNLPIEKVRSILK